jgi:hypothetical protein
VSYRAWVKVRDFIQEHESFDTEEQCQAWCLSKELEYRIDRVKGWAIYHAETDEWDDDETGPIEMVMYSSYEDVVGVE